MLTTSRLLAASLAFATVLGTAAWAQQPPTVRIRGTIEAVDGAMLSIKSREGTDMKVRMTDNVAVFGVVKTEMSEIKEGSYIGVTAMPEPDGTQKAVAVHIFPENQRGAAEGFRPWDQRPNSTMTNATVAADGQGHRRPEHPGQVQGRREESRGAAGHADRHLRRRRQVRAQARRQDHHLRRGRKRMTARWKPTASMSAATGSPSNTYCALAA